MGTITTGIGLFSGIDSRSIIDQLLAIDARPRVFAQRRIVELQQIQTAYLDINSTLKALQSAASSIITDKTFDATSAASSNDAVISATAGSDAAEGVYKFTVDRLVSTQQFLSRGFADRDVSGVGVSSFTVEHGAGGITSETTLAELNGGSGVRRGTLIITDQSGDDVTIDLSRAVTVDDVIEAVNSNGVLDITARVDGDGITLTNGAGDDFTVTNAIGSTIATELGLLGTSSSGELAGTRVRTLSGNMALSALNDGLGVGLLLETAVSDNSFDLRIVLHDGTELKVKLGEVLETTNRKKESGEIIETEDGPGPGETTIKLLDPDTRAILETITDQVEVQAILDEQESVTEAVETRSTTLEDVIERVTEAATAAGLTGADFSLAIDANATGLVVTDNTVGAGALIIESAVGHSTAEDLGIDTGPGGFTAGPTFQGTRLLAGINSVLVSKLNGGAGVVDKLITFTDGAGLGTGLNLASFLDGSLSDLIEGVNGALESAGNTLRLSGNRAGNGLAVTDTGVGGGAISVTGDAADPLGIDFTGVTSGAYNGANIQHQWIGGATSLDDLNVGQGIGQGEFRITDATGSTRTFNITTNIRTVDELLSQINAQVGLGVEARINDSGDGIAIIDTSGGGGKLVIEDITGNVARSLNLEGEFEKENPADPEITADGSYERRVEFDALDTLDEIADTFNKAGLGVRVNVLSDGSPVNPFRLNFTSDFTGRDGRAIVDTGDFDLEIQTLNPGEDAIVFFGSADPASAVLLTSSTDTLDDVIRGVTIDLNGTSSEPVEITVAGDTTSVETAVSDVVDRFNEVLNTLDRYDRFDQETERRGILLGDSTVATIRRSLYSNIQSQPQGVNEEFRFLFEVGVSIGDGARLEFDREEFREALTENPQAVERLFAARTLIPNEPIQVLEGVEGITVADTEDDFSELGLLAILDEMVKDMTNSIDGLLTQRGQTLDGQITLQERRIEGITEQIDAKRLKLERQFLVMEQAIAQLQTQQSALSSLSFIG